MTKDVVLILSDFASDPYILWWMSKYSNYTVVAYCFILSLHIHYYVDGIILNVYDTIFVSQPQGRLLSINTDVFNTSHDADQVYNGLVLLSSRFGFECEVLDFPSVRLCWLNLVQLGIRSSVVPRVQTHKMFLFVWLRPGQVLQLYIPLSTYCGAYTCKLNNCIMFQHVTTIYI